MRGGHQWRKPARRKLAFRSFGFRKTRRRIRGEIREGKFAWQDRQQQDRHVCARSVEAVREQQRRKSVLGATRFAGSDEGEMRSALDHLKTFWERAARGGVTGNRDFNPGWHTALDLKNLLTVSEAITRAALERKESRGAQFREDYPEKDERFSKVNTLIRKGEDGGMEVLLEPLPEMPDYLKQIIEENR